MLSYQHIYHAGNLADVHKHGLLAWILGYLTRKDKPLTYIETHAGRALYDLDSAEARKTAEAAHGIQRAEGLFPPEHPYPTCLQTLRSQHGPGVYPGSPMLAAMLARPSDSLHLAELHPGEHAALRDALRGYPARVHLQDGFALAHALVPPMPRRGLLLIDPSYEIKDDYRAIPRHVAAIRRAWNVGVIAVWYPVLRSGAERGMVATLKRAHSDALVSEVRFAPARPGHGMIGSGLFVINPPFGLADEARRLEAGFSRFC